MIRNRFFSGRLLTAEDFELEQQYFREKLKRHNRNLHGFGVVSGLEVSKSSGNAVTIAPGVAIDCAGNEIVVESPVKHFLSGSSEGTIFLALRYAEHASNPLLSPDLACHLEPSRIEETFTIITEKQNTHQGHRHSRGRWGACGEPHGLTIARLKRSAGQWRLERRYKPPRLS